MNQDNLMNDAGFWRMMCFILLFLLGFSMGTGSDIAVRRPIPQPKPTYINPEFDDRWLDREYRTI